MILLRDEYVGITHSIAQYHSCRCLLSCLSSCTVFYFISVISTHFPEFLSSQFSQLLPPDKSIQFPQSSPNHAALNPSWQPLVCAFPHPTTLRHCCKPPGASPLDVSCPINPGKHVLKRSRQISSYLLQQSAAPQTTEYPVLLDSYVLSVTGQLYVNLRPRVSILRVS